ncbi:hypothetical protein CYMTET_47530 [Cymbomonas tetramitiformis]|uniref:Uncharacterized protein n=1 Tax=Cymbomonas tetramitiformis TaxID=36881 RepID=A0AAE0EXM5_9CHLO|nr:hypothetical protein CYMTET_47530 [Cymbomonas tetramitiformis]
MGTVAEHGWLKDAARDGGSGASAGSGTGAASEAPVGPMASAPGGGAGYTGPGCAAAGVSHQEGYAQLKYPTRADPRPIMAKDHRLVRDDWASDWKPDEASRRQRMFASLNANIYRSVTGRFPLPRDLAAISLITLQLHVAAVYTSWAQSLIAERGSAGGTLTAASAVTGGDGESDPGLRDLVVEMCRKMKLLEQFLKQLRGGVAAVKAAKGQRGSMAGFPTGSQAVPQVGFDRNTRRALPRCDECSQKHNCGIVHMPKDCVLQAKDGAAAHYFMPGDIESMRTLAVCQVFQDRLQEGHAAVAAACEMHGAMAVLGPGGAGSTLVAGPVHIQVLRTAAASLVDDEKECENGITAAAASAVPAVGEASGGNAILWPSGAAIFHHSAGFGRPRDVLWLNLHVYSLPENAVKVWLGLLQANGAGSAPAAGNAWPGGVDIPTDGIP